MKIVLTSRIIVQNEAHIDWETAMWNTKAAWRRIATCIGLGFVDAPQLDETSAK